MEEDKKLAKRRKLNMKLYPIYKMISTDVLFYNAVKVLFLTQVKLISNADVVFLESLYALFKMIFTIPMTTIAAKLGKRRSIVLGNILVTLEFVTILISRNFMFLVLSQIISALGWSLRSTTESPFLNSSIPETKNKGKIFTKIDSKGYSKYCYIAAIATILAGFFYEINPYIPLILAILFDTLGLIISLNFIDVKEEKKVETKTIKESIIEVKNDFKFIFKSPRLKSLLLMIGFMWGMICLFGTYQTTLLKDIHVPAKYIGIILAVLEIIQGKASTKANSFNEKHKNKTLTYIGIRMSIGIAIAGGVVVIGLSRIPQLAIIIFTYVLRMFDRGVFQILKKKYLGNFMTPDILTKVYSANSVCCSMFRMLVGAVGSFLLTIMTIEYAMVTAGILFTIVMLILSLSIKTKIGLKPEEYTKKDVAYMQ